MGTAEHSENFTLGLTRKTLEGVIIRSCTNCRAPGVYSSAQSIQAGWPKCYVPEDSELLNRPVGNICPQCGSVRPSDERRGELCASIPKSWWYAALWLKWLIIKWKQFKSRETISWT